MAIKKSSELPVFKAPSGKEIPYSRIHELAFGEGTNYDDISKWQPLPMDEEEQLAADFYNDLMQPKAPAPPPQAAAPVAQAELPPPPPAPAPPAQAAPEPPLTLDRVHRRQAQLHLAAAERLGGGPELLKHNIAYGKHIDAASWLERSKWDEKAGAKALEYSASAHKYTADLGPFDPDSLSQYVPPPKPDVPLPAPQAPQPAPAPISPVQGSIQPSTETSLQTAGKDLQAALFADPPAAEAPALKPPIHPPAPSPATPELPFFKVPSYLREEEVFDAIPYSGPETLDPPPESIWYRPSQPAPGTPWTDITPIPATGPGYDRPSLNLDPAPAPLAPPKPPGAPLKPTTQAAEGPKGFVDKVAAWVKANPKKSIGLGIGLGVALVGNLFSGFDDRYNYIEGMRHAGFAGMNRKTTTDFGSGWRGLIKIPEGIGAHFFHGEAGFVSYGEIGLHTVAGWESYFQKGLKYASETKRPIMEEVLQREAPSFLKNVSEAEKRGRNPVFINTFTISASSGDLGIIQKYMPEALENAPAEVLAQMPPPAEAKRRFGQNLRSMIKHERVHQKQIESTGALRQGEAPEGFYETLREASGGKLSPYGPETALEEYTAYRTQYDSFPDTVLPGVREFFEKEFAEKGIQTKFQRKQQIIQKRAERRLLKKSEPVPGRPESNTQGNTIAGFQEASQITGKKGFGAKLRKFFGFGSPWQGLKTLGKTALKGAFSGDMKPITIASLAVGGIALGTMGLSAGISGLTGGMGGGSLGFLKGGTKGAVIGALGAGFGSALLANEGQKRAGAFGGAFIGAVTTSVGASLLATGQARGGAIYKAIMEGAERIAKPQGIDKSELTKGLSNLLGRDVEGAKGFAMDLSETLANSERLMTELGQTPNPWLVKANKFFANHPRLKRYADASIGSPKLLEEIEKAGDVTKVSNKALFGALRQDIVEGLPLGIGAGVVFSAFGHTGFGGGNRSSNTDFGSPWQGLTGPSMALSQQMVQPYRERQNPSGLNKGYQGEVSQRGIWSYTVEDADTVRLMLSGGNTMTLRLAGIDAPETEHGDDYASGRVNQDQPYGQKAKAHLEALLAQQQSLSVMFDPNSETYGRNVGVLMGDGGQNINLSLVAEGAAAALPFGSVSSRMFDTGAFRRAEKAAYQQQVGMWQEASWRAVRDAQDDNKRRVTNTSLTQMGRMFENFDTASLAIRLNNPDTALAGMHASGGKDDFNIIEGLDHGWYGSSRRENTDFGSGYILRKGIPTLRSGNEVKRRLMSGHKLARTQSMHLMDQKNLTSHQYG